MRFNAPSQQCGRVPFRWAFGLLLLTLGIIAAPSRAQEQATTVPKDVVTRHAYLETVEAMYRRVLDDAVSRASLELNDAALGAFLDQSSAHLAYDREVAVYWPTDLMKPSALVVAGAKLDEETRKTPIIEYLLVRAKTSAGSSVPGRDHADALVAASERVRASDASEVLKWRAAWDVIDLDPLIGIDIASLIAARADAEKHLIAAFSPDGVHESEQRFVIRGMFERHRASRGYGLKPLVDAIVAAEGHAWATEIVLGRYELEVAFDERGRGWADSVTPEGWEGFAEHMQKSARHYQTAHELHPEWPEAATALVEVVDKGRLRQFSSGTHWFTRATEAEIDGRGAYSRRAHNLLPRWGGSYEEMLELAHEAAELQRFDTELPLVMASVYEAIRRDLASDVTFMRGSKDWAVLDEGLRGMRQVAARDGDWREAGLIGRHAVWAWAFGDFATAVELFESSFGETGAAMREFDAQVRRLNGVPESARAECYALTSPEREAIEHAIDLEGLNDAQVLADAWQGILSRLHADNKGRRWVLARANAAKFAAGIESGEWTNVPVDATCWETVDGSWTFFRGTMTGRAEVSGDRPLAVLRLPLPDEYELSFEFEAVEGQPQANLVGLCGTYRDDKSPFGMLDLQSYDGVVLRPGGEPSVMFDGEGVRDYVEVMAKAGRAVPLEVSAQVNRRMVGYMGGNQLLAGFRFRPDQFQPRCIAIMGVADEAGAAFRVKNMRIRKLP